MCWHPLEAYLRTAGSQLVLVVITISLTRSSRALAESDPMEEIAALESLEMTIADGGV